MEDRLLLRQPCRVDRGGSATATMAGKFHHTVCVMWQDGRWNANDDDDDDDDDGDDDDDSPEREREWKGIS